VALAGRLHVEAENEVLAAGKAQRGPFERKAAAARAAGSSSSDPRSME
jgi:hypothetical protein